MNALDIQLGQQVRYTGKDKFGFENEHTGQIFTVIARKWDHGGNEYLFHVQNEWHAERINVPASVLEEVT